MEMKTTQFLLKFAQCDYQKDALCCTCMWVGVSFGVLLLSMWIDKKMRKRTVEGMEKLQ